MSEDFIPFWRLVVSAEHMLQSTADPDEMEDMARALIRKQPSSALADRLLDHAAYLRTISPHMRGSGDTKNQQVRSRTAA